jgi:hypothetical protein
MDHSYVGQTSQVYGVEEHRLVGGKSDEMRLFEIRNGSGLELTVSADRCADISRASFCGVNLSWFSPVGYVAPAYYDDRGLNFLRSFTGGFFTTCGLTAAGSPCADGGEDVPLHGRIANTPAEHVYYTEDDREICLFATVRQASVFGEKLMLRRKITCPVGENRLVLTDTIENEGEKTEPLMMLYHMNMGYPLLDENAELTIPSDSVAPRDNRAAEGIDSWQKLLAPQPQFAEQCYYHTFSGSTGSAQLINRKAGVGVKISFPTDPFCCFTQWKQMGKRAYVLGLEPGNCTPDGRDVLRCSGRLKFIEPGEQKTFSITVDFLKV